MQQFLFFHGWGFDSSIWSPLVKALGLPAAFTPDRGYFGATPTGPYHEDEPVVAVTHSLGTMRFFLETPRIRFSKLIIINGFARFVRSDDYPLGIPARLVSRMQQRFSEDANAILTDFRARAGGLPVTVPVLDRQKLAADLALLAVADARPRLASVTVPVLVLASEDDDIVPPEMTRMAFASRSTPVIWAKSGGHLLPLNRVEWCASQIDKFLTK